MITNFLIFKAEQFVCSTEDSEHNNDVWLIAAVNDSVGADLPVRREQTHVEPRQKLRVYYQVSNMHL